MAIYAIGDLHLPGHQEKPMNVFGDHWDRHFDVIRENWLSMVAREDVGLIPGDISWAMTLADAKVAKFTDGMDIVKVILVKNKLVNLIVK